MVAGAPRMILSTDPLPDGSGDRGRQEKEYGRRTPASCFPSVAAQPLALLIFMDLRLLLQIMAEKNASDLHLRSNKPAVFRVDGNLSFRTPEAIPG